MVILFTSQKTYFSFPNKSRACAQVDVMIILDGVVYCPKAAVVKILTASISLEEDFMEAILFLLKENYNHIKYKYHLMGALMTSLKHNS